MANLVKTERVWHVLKPSYDYYEFDDGTKIKVYDDGSKKVITDDGCWVTHISPNGKHCTNHCSNKY